MDAYDPLTGDSIDSDPDCIEFPQPKSNGKGPDKAAAKANVEPAPSAEAVHEVLADNLRDMTGATFVYFTVASSLSGDIDPQAFKIYRDKLLQDAGNPSDPLETMLLEQLALAHFNIGRLQMKSCAVENAKLAVAYSDAATRLLGEFRRCTLALEDFRAKQIARKDRKATTASTGKEPLADRNRKPLRPINGRKPSANRKKPPSRKKKPAYNKVTTTGEIPECLRQRMGLVADDALTQTAEIGANGRG
jgi:hypothetical protein